MRPILLPGAMVPIPDALAAFANASPAEQLRRTAVVLRGARRIYGRRVASLSGCLFLLARVDGVHAAAERARHVLQAVVGGELRRWEAQAARAHVRTAIRAALAYCAPARPGWLVAL